MQMRGEAAYCLHCRAVTLVGVVRKECVGKHGEATDKAILFMSTCDTVDFYYEVCTGEAHAALTCLGVHSKELAFPSVLQLLRRFTSNGNPDQKRGMARSAAALSGLQCG